VRAVLVGIETQAFPQIWLVEDYVEPEPLPGEARIRTTIAGICNTDIEIVRGYAGFQGVLGHDLVGIVDRAGDPAPMGQRVVGEINAACEILEQIHVHPTDRAVVLGDGKLGLLVAQVLALTGCKLTAIGRHRKKLALLTARGIHTHIGDEGLVGRADLVVECTGQAEGSDTARRIVRPRGTLVIKSTYHGLVQTDLSRLVVDKVRVVGSRCGPFGAALRLLAQALVEVTSLSRLSIHWTRP